MLRRLPQHDFVAPEHIAQEVKPVSFNGVNLGVRFQRQFQFGELYISLPQKIPEFVFVR